MTHTPEPAFRNLDHISSNAQDTSKLAALSARIADLEAQLYAIGAGGVGESIKPQIQADTAPAAWAIYSDDGTAIRLWSRCKASAQDAADKFGLPLVALYTAPQLAAQPEPEQQKPVALVKVLDAGGNAGIATRIVEIDDPMRERLQPGTKLYTAPQPPAVDQQFDTWSHDDGDSWYDNPGDAEIIQSCLGRDAKIGDEYELWASIDAVTLRYRIVAQHGDDFEVECISQPQQKTAPRLPAAQQEPVAWRVRPFDYGIGHEGVDALTARKEQCEMWERKGWKVEPLYTAPQPARQPLTDEQILSIVRAAPALDTVEAEFLHIARTIESAHGITGGQQ